MLRLNNACPSEEQATLTIFQMKIETNSPVITIYIIKLIEKTNPLREEWATISD